MEYTQIYVKFHADSVHKAKDIMVIDDQKQ